MQRATWVALLVIAALSGTAEAKKSSGFMTGETIESLDMPTGALAEKARAALGGGGVVSFGFKYSYVGFGTAPLWTYDGNFVIYNSAGGNVSQYIVLTDDEIKQFNNGTIPSKPFLYRVPIGLIIFPALLVGAGVAYLMWRRRQKRAKREADTAGGDPRYVQALRMTEPVEHRDEDGDLVTAPRHSHEDAVNWLVAQGIPRDKAEANYSALADKRDGAD
jgi:hypothetical protein